MLDYIVPEAKLILGDAIQKMQTLPDKFYDLAIVDPPYGASTKADWSLTKEHTMEGFGGEWKLADHAWDQLTGMESFNLTLAWMKEMKRLVKPTGSFWVHATYHNAGFVNVACQILGLEIINEVVWFKRNAFPNLAARRLTASHETIYWVHTGNGKREYRFNYDEVKKAAFPEDKLKEAGKQLRTVWDIPSNKKREEIKYGAHPTQKPLRLIQRLLLISGIQNGQILIPFLGSGSEAVAAIQYSMIPTGFEIAEPYFDVACQRCADAIEQLHIVRQEVLL